MGTYTETELKEIMRLHTLYIQGAVIGVRANLSGADLRWEDLIRMDLRYADLSGADLSDADLRWVNLGGADLSGSRLSGARLSGADLSDANMYRADLSGARLRYANLSGANLIGANLSGAIMQDGTKWETYLSETVPALLTAGGKTITEIVKSGAWECHEWSNCPMHAAFGIDNPNQGPTLLRPRITEFVLFFDAWLIPCPIVEEVS